MLFVLYNLLIYILDYMLFVLYDLLQNIDKFRGRSPPPTPSTKYDGKAHVLRYLISNSTCFEM
jgi:hypothetical protein